MVVAGHLVGKTSSAVGLRTVAQATRCRPKSTPVQPEYLPERSEQPGGQLEPAGRIGAGSKLLAELELVVG